jgi:hypothetical protein
MRADAPGVVADRQKLRNQPPGKRIHLSWYCAGWLNPQDISGLDTGQVSKNLDSTFLVPNRRIRTNLGCLARLFAPNMLNKFILSNSVDALNSCRVLFKRTMSNASLNLK